MGSSAGKVRLRRVADRNTPSLALTAKSIEGFEDILVLDVEGRIINPTAAEFQGFVDGLLADPKYRRLVLDLSKLQEVGSVGLAYFSQIRDRLTELVLVGVQGKVRVVMKMLGLLGVFREFEKKEQALRALLLPSR